MRAWLVLLLLPLPWAGCLEAPPLTALSVFSIPGIERGDPTPRAARSCADLLDDLNERALTHARVSLEQNLQEHRRYARLDRSFSAQPEQMAASAPQAASSGSARGAEVTGTNNQEAAADESDLVKTDGEWTYVFSEGVLHILHSERVGDMREHARRSYPASYGGELLLEPRNPDDPDDDRLVLLFAGAPNVAKGTPSNDHPYPGGMTRVLVLSLADRSDPQVEFDAWIEGQSNGARLVDGHAYVVVHRWEPDLGLQRWASPDEESLRERGESYDGFAQMPAWEQDAILRDLALDADKENQARLAKLTLKDHLPTILRPRGSTMARPAIDEATCRRVLTTPDSTGRGFTTIMALALEATTVRSSVTQVMGGQPIVYASGEALVLAAPSQDFWWFWAQPDLLEATDLQWFDLDGLNVRQRASGRVPGIVRDSFGLDVEGEELRVATTTGTWGRWWDEDPEPMMSHVAVFESKAGHLVPRGIVGGIAPGERIWSARFTKDRAYLVTFRQTDPLWVVDLSGEPKILGELEIPGVSTYIHPLDDGALLTIGLGPGRGGEGLDWGKLQVSLFDLSDVKKPRRADVLDLVPAGGHGWSGALHEHKAFTYWDRVQTLAVPLSTQRSYETTRSGTWVSEHHVGLRLIHVDRGALDLSRHGEVDQDDLQSAGDAWGGDIQRAYFLGYPEKHEVSVYAVSPLGVTSHDLATLRAQDVVGFRAE